MRVELVHEEEDLTPKGPGFHICVEALQEGVLMVGLVKGAHLIATSEELSEARFADANMSSDREMTNGHLLSSRGFIELACGGGSLFSGEAAEPISAAAVEARWIANFVATSDQ